MTRIYTTLVLFAVLFVAANFILGLSLGDLRTDRSLATQSWGSVHRLLGVFAAIGVVLVKSIAVTYFIGTSRWCKEVSETYRLEDTFTREANRLKRKTFPWAVMSMLAAVGLVALGGACDPGSGLQNSADWVTPHLIGAMLALAFIGWASYIEWNNIQANHAIIERVMAEVRRIRTARGLDVDVVNDQ